MKKITEQDMLIISGGRISGAECFAWGLTIFSPLIAPIGFALGKYQECWNS
jgi:hypothetical protein